MEAGDTLLTAGTGFDADVTWNASAPLIPPPGAGLETLTGTFPATSSADAGMMTTIVVEVTDAGATWIPPKLTVDVPLKLFPDKVSGKLLPTGILVGEMLDNTGTPFCIASPIGLTTPGGGPEDPPPGPGLLTPRLNVGPVTDFGAAAAAMVNVTGWLVPPPGADVVTVTESTADFCSNAVGITAVAEVADLYAAGKVWPAIETVVRPLTNPVPVKVTVVSGLPATMLVGETPVNVGAGAVCAAAGTPPEKTPSKTNTKANVEDRMSPIVMPQR